MLKNQIATNNSGRLNFLEYMKEISNTKKIPSSNAEKLANNHSSIPIISPTQDGILPELNHVQVHQILEVEAVIDSQLPMLIDACHIFDSAGFDVTALRVAVRSIAAYKNIIDEVKFDPRCSRLAKYELQRKGG